MDREGSHNSPEGTTLGLEKEPVKREIEDYQKELEESGPIGGLGGHQDHELTAKIDHKNPYEDDANSPDDLEAENGSFLFDDGEMPADVGPVENTIEDEFELSWSCLKDVKNEEEENERLRFLLHDNDSDINEDLSNLAEVIPGLVSIHRTMMYQGSSNVLSSPNKAYSSKVLGSVHNLSSPTSSKKERPENEKESRSIEITRSPDAVDMPPKQGLAKVEEDENEDKSVALRGSLAALNLVHGGVEIIPPSDAGGLASRRVSIEDIPEDHDQEPCASPLKSLNVNRVIIPENSKFFKPATGCRDASDFIVRCIVARLRSGITVVKHAHSRWAKSQLRTFTIHEDGRSLTWNPAIAERKAGSSGSSVGAIAKANKKRSVPKLDLRECFEVRHAWTTDPNNPNFTGTKVLRLKCEPENAHKSFSLMFADRTVDITAMTADQCRVLMEGFSALCYRLQMAMPLTGNNKINKKKFHSRISLR